MKVTKDINVFLFFKKYISFKYHQTAYILIYKNMFINVYIIIN